MEIKSLFEDIKKEQSLLIKRHPESNPNFPIYYGFSRENRYRIAYKSKTKPILLKSTKSIRVQVVTVNQTEHWLYFDLLEADIVELFYKFFETIIESLKDLSNEKMVISRIVFVFNSWKKLFNNSKEEMSVEIAQGLFGELLTILSTPLNDNFTFQYSDMILGWGAGDLLTKDFSMDTTWFEVKTKKNSSDEIKIASLDQLNSNSIGYLVVITVELMSEKYESKPASINDLVEEILNRIDDPNLQNDFLDKLENCKYDFYSQMCNKKFSPISINYYKVDNSFPRLTPEDIKKPEVIKVSYSISAKSIEGFKL